MREGEKMKTRVEVKGGSLLSAPSSAGSMPFKNSPGIMRSKFLFHRGKDDKNNFSSASQADPNWSNVYIATYKILSAVHIRIGTL